MRKLIPLMLLALSTLAFAQNEQSETEKTETTTLNSDVQLDDGIVTIASRGGSVRDVLFDLFDQTKHSFVLEPNIHFILYLSLSGVEFEEALSIVCNVAKLDYTIDNGIYFVGKKKVGATDMTKVKVTTPQPQPNPKRGKLTAAEMNKRLTTRFARTEITKVFEAMAKQTGVEIIVDKNVPLLRIDAYLIDTSLQYALDVISRATGLKYKLTDDKQILVSKK